MVEIIIKGRSTIGKTRSEAETNLRKEWGKTMSEEKLDKLKFLEREYKRKTGSTKNFFRGQDIDKVK